MAAEIEGNDIASKEAIEAPYKIKKGVDELIASITKLQSLTKTSEGNVMMAKSVGAVAKETDNLSLAQKELAKINNQILVAQAKNNKAYQEEAEKLAAVKKEMKDAAAASKNLSGSYNEFNKQVTDAKKKLKEMEGGLHGASQEFKDLQKFVAEGSKRLKEWDSEVGDNQRKVGDYEGAIKGLKLEFKAAKDEMAGIARTLGTNSAEFEAATLKAGALKDEIGDLEKATSNLAGSKLENLSATFGDTFSKLKSGDFGGALESAKQFATVAKSISFAEAGKSLKEFGQTLLTIGKAILTNPMFLIPAAIALVIAALYKFKDSIPFVSKAIKFFSDGIDIAIQGLKDFSDWLGVTTFAIDAKAKATEEATKKEMAAIEKRYDHEIKLAQAAGKATEELEKKKFNDLIRRNEAEIERLEAYVKGSKEQVEALKQINQDYKNEIEIIDAQVKKKKEDAAKELAEKEKQNLKEASARLKEHLKNLLVFIQDATHKERVLEDDKFSKSLADQINYYMQSEAMQDVDIQTRLAMMKEFGIDASAVQKIVADRLLKQDIDDGQKRRKTLEEGEIELQAALIDLKNQAFQTANDLANNFFDAETQRLDGRKNDLETRMADELTAAGDNANAKAAIESRFAAQIKAIENEQRAVKRKQAIANKAIAAFQIGVNTAIGISNALAVPPPPVGIALAAVIGIMGALQLAAVLTKPLPAFKDGGITKDSIIVAGEEGTEAYQTPSGQVGLTPNKATVMRLPVGTEIIPHEDTMKALAYASLGREVSVDYGNMAMLNRLERIEATQSRIGSAIVNAVKKGKTNFSKQGSLLYEIIEMENGNKKRIRAKSMGG